MTIPYLMNCTHSPDGWCLDCVKAMGERLATLEHALKQAHYPCVECGFLPECDCAFDGYNVGEVAGITCLMSK